MSNTSRLIAAVLAVTVAACMAGPDDLDSPDDTENPDDPNPDDPTPDDPTPDDPTPDDPEPEPEPPTGPLDFTGTYDLESTWDLSGAIAADSLGDLVAALLIEQVVGSLGLPGFLEDDAIDALSSIAHDPIAEFIDANTPDVLDADTGVIAELADILREVHIVGELELSDPDGTLEAAEGVKRITAVRIELDGTSVDVPIEHLVSLAGGDSIEADVTAQVFDRETLVFDAHELVMRTDPLVSLGLSDLLSIDDIEQLAADALDCDAAIEALTGGDSLTLDLGLQDVTVSASTLVSGCEAVRAEALDRLFGMFQTELGIEIAGPSVMIDEPADLAVDRIESLDGHAGVLVSLPESARSAFEIGFVATRNEM